jgi:quercetin dioxygenase-like cupin family protein
MLDESHLPGWADAACRDANAHGEAWCLARRSLLLIMPGVVARPERNILINPEFPALTVSLHRPVWWGCGCIHDPKFVTSRLRDLLSRAAGRMLTKKRHREKTMDTTAFSQRLRREGYVEGDAKSLEPGMVNAEHEHPFDVCGLVLDGEIALTVEGTRTPYRAGEIFTLAAGCPHAEAIGAAGVRYVIGRRPPTPES